MSRLTPDERWARVAADCFIDAWQQAWATTWIRRAEALEAALPRPGDDARRGRLLPAVDPDGIARRAAALTEAAAACRARATGRDGVALHQLGDTAVDIVRSSAA